MLILFALNSCEDKKHETTIIPIENTTEIFTNKDKKIPGNKQKVVKEKKIEEVNMSILSQKNITTHGEITSNDFTLKNKQHTYHITLLNHKLTFRGTQKPIVFINLFKADCSACLSQISAFKKLERKYKKELFVLNLSDDMQNKELIRFAHALQNSLEITINTSPLSVIYKNGNYYNHFEGLAPIEMISHDIQQAIKKMKV